MPSFTPILIDTVDVGFSSQKQPSQGSTNSGKPTNMVVKIGPISSGANQYLVMGTNTLHGVAQVWKSTDNGNTWNKVDSAHAPACRNWVSFFNKANGKFVIAYISDVAGGTAQPVHLIGFNPATDLYENVAGNPGASPGIVHAVFSCVQRSDNSVVIFGIDDSGSPGSYKYLIWDGAAVWSITGFDVTGLGQSQSVSACVDSNDRTHFINSTGAGAAYTVNYWNLSKTNVLSGPTAFLWVTATGIFQNFAPSIDVSDSLDTLYIGNCLTNGAGDTEGRIFFGSPRSAPVWNGLVTGALIGTLPVGTSGSAPPYISVGSDGNLYLVVPATTAGNGQIWLFRVPASNNPISGWNLSMVFDISLSTVPMLAQPSDPSIAVTDKAKLYFNGATTGTGITRFLLKLPAPPGVGKKILSVPFPRPLPWPVGSPRLTDGKHFMIK